MVPEKGRRNHEDQDELDCVCGCGCVAVGMAGCEAGRGAERACCSQVSRVLWSTGHFASSPAGEDEEEVISGVGREAEALSAAMLESLRLTRTVSSRSLCIIKVASSGRSLCEESWRSPETSRALGALKLSSRCQRAWR